MRIKFAFITSLGVTSSEIGFFPNRLDQSVSISERCCWKLSWQIIIGCSHITNWRACGRGIYWMLCATLKSNTHLQNMSDGASFSRSHYPLSQSELNRSWHLTVRSFPLKSNSRRFAWDGRWEMSTRAMHYCNGYRSMMIVRVVSINCSVMPPLLSAPLVTWFKAQCDHSIGQIRRLANRLSSARLNGCGTGGARSSHSIHPGDSHSIHPGDSHSSHNSIHEWAFPRRRVRRRA